MAKRLFDVCCAAVALVFTAPLIALAAIGIKLTDPGPVFFRARRVGYLGRQFTMLKLRTMKVGGGCERSGPVITGLNDDRVSSIGKILRRTKIDELPQLFNVLRGDMAIVGPRPEDPTIVRQHYSSADLETLGVRPGLASPGSIYQYTSGDHLLTGADPEAHYVDKLLMTIGAVATGRRKSSPPPEMSAARRLLAQDTP
jgi:lipopolysaccharide/colanic/teichoic acid biosynthesis glycosyltransferase